MQIRVADFSVLQTELYYIYIAIISALDSNVIIICVEHFLPLNLFLKHRYTSHIKIIQTKSQTRDIAVSRRKAIVKTLIKTAKWFDSGQLNS